ncbi:MAG: FAD:protein FMN transferase [Oscillospiraceae bacterium]|nr:FAD:protein FMN transferase [Oscillospiraceae bacterium]
MKKVFLPLLILLLLLTGCAPKTESLDIFAMDTYMTLVAVGDGAFDALQTSANIVNTLEQSMSRTVESSDVSVLNAAGSAELGFDTAALLEEAIALSEATGGCFDVTVAPLVELWNINSDTPYVPTQAEIDALLPSVGSEHISLDGGIATLDEGCAIDLGGIAKGFASDRIAQLYHERELKGGFISLGGNVYVHGDNTDGEAWSVAIQHPEDMSGYACMLHLRDAFVVTSGGYQRNFTAPDGTVYQHILDPATGKPANSDLLSVSIILPYDDTALHGSMADAYSTALYVMGETGACDFWALRQNFDMVLVTADGRVIYTPGLIDQLSPVEESGYDYQVLTA